MKITVLGGGAMGSLFGGYLSRSADVTIVDVNGQVIEAIRENGVTVVEKDGTRNVMRPDAVTDTAGKGPQDLIIVFVKAMYSAEDDNTEVLYLEDATATFSSFTEPPRTVKF